MGPKLPQEPVLVHPKLGPFQYHGPTTDLAKEAQISTLATPCRAHPYRGDGDYGGGSVGHLYAGQTPWEDLTSTEKIVHLNIIARKNIGRRKQLGCSVEDMKEQTAGTALAYLMPWCEPFLRKA
eukprot:gnl/TRDRNA2_/TRDRNA2_166319_c0_seq3.p1 gnl/TRDRNA2_/TRDRNA2_166319_c0~~gnl/TRDRNA2_/TRDRNA2_166319_c0_seq3.p1  ORF type:complete len:141 (-),score=10.64 gnl/TRDRNA2_/TRDRNA2_166319_c0_seq3:111-482(-)